MDNRSSIAGIELPDHSDRQSYSITDLSEEFGVTARALRFYEDEGLISPERQGLSRIYSRHNQARGSAQLKDSVEQDVSGTSPWRHEEVHTADRLTKTGSKICAQLTHKENQERRHRHGQDDQGHWESP